MTLATTPESATKANTVQAGPTEEKDEEPIVQIMLSDIESSKTCVDLIDQVIAGISTLQEIESRLMQFQNVAARVKSREAIEARVQHLTNVSDKGDKSPNWKATWFR